MISTYQVAAWGWGPHAGCRGEALTEITGEAGRQLFFGRSGSPDLSDVALLRELERHHA
jgi:hypothetical protein